MKALKKIVVWGGAFLLTLSVIAGVLLITVPAKNENINTVNAATEEIDGQEYAVFAVYGTTTVDEIRTFYTDHAKVKFVLQENWVYKPATATNGDAGLWSRNGGILGGYVVLDLNGYTIDCAMPEAVSKGYGVGILAEYAQVWDSSPAGTGCVQGGLYVYNRTLGNCHLSIYGGTIDKILVYLNTPWADAPEFTCEIYGGNIGYLASYPTILGTPISAFTKVVIDGGTVDSVDPDITNVTSVVNGVEYQTYYIFHDTDLAAITNHYSQNRCTKFILQEDWAAVQNNGRECLWRDTTFKPADRQVILDLNGHTIDTYANSVTRLGIAARHVELWDSSPDGTGRIDGNFYTYNQTGGGTMHFYMYGGTITGTNLYIDVNGTAGLNVEEIWFEIYGGSVNQVVLAISNVAQGEGKGSLTTVKIYGGRVGGIQSYITERGSVYIAPYMLTNADGSVQEYAGYAIANNNLVTGIYNYNFGLVWELRAYQLLQQVISADKMYYLWGRNADGAYAYLNIVYRDGQWVKIDPENSVA